MRCVAEAPDMALIIALSLGNTRSAEKLRLFVAAGYRVRWTRISGLQQLAQPCLTGFQAIEAQDQGADAVAVTIEFTGGWQQASFFVQIFLHIVQKRRGGAAGPGVASLHRLACLPGRN